LTLRRLTFEALGSRCELFGIDVDEARLADGAAWVLAMHGRLTRFDPGSELSRFNAGAGDWRAVSAPLEALLRESLRAYERSGGLVHAGVLTRMLAIGYTRTFAQGPTETRRPDPSPLPPLPDILAVRPGEARLERGFGIDLGGIAKGWLADRLVERLGDNSLANLGGDLFARGGGEAADGWPVGFGGRTVLLVDLGAATTGTQRRRWGEGLHHLIDPRTGLPAVTDASEVSVIAETATDAEWLAKAALILGRERGTRLLAARASGYWFAEAPSPETS
jgi:thiamine biosynthesis lipoprotein